MERLLKDLREEAHSYLCQTERRPSAPRAGFQLQNRRSIRMSEGVLRELRQGLPTEERLEYTRRAFRLLPRIEKPNILDIGCGPGLPTVELARLSGGTVTGIDIDRAALDRMLGRARKLGVSDRVKAVRCPMDGMEFADATFDIVWNEGAVWILGFEEGLREWRRFIKPGGFLVVHDMCWLEPDPPSQILDYWRRTYPGISTHEHNLARVRGCGYELLAHFPLPENAWWDLYFDPLARRMPRLRSKYADDHDALRKLEEEEEQADLCRRYSRWYGSAFYIMRKR
jgi:ubiquinone/menaquinone biosynthesis C-methylase UbiE